MAAYARFTPNDSEQRLHPPYYRGCWHGVSRCFLWRYRQISSLPTGLYDPKTFIAHAALLRQSFLHCAIFPTAASRRSLGRVSVPVWLIILSDQLSIFDLVGHYPTNYLMDRGPILGRKSIFSRRRLSGISSPFGELFQSQGYVPTCYSPVRRSRLPRRRASPSTCMC